MLECKNITPKDKDGKAHGYWERYWSDGELYYKGSYHHGKQHGYWERYWSDGELYYKGVYYYGERVGYWVWHYNITKYYAIM